MSVLSPNEEEFRKELSEKDEKARKELPDFCSCQENQKELQAMLQDHKQLWKQISNQEETRHLHADVRQLQVRRLLEK